MRESFLDRNKPGLLRSRYRHHYDHLFRNLIFTGAAACFLPLSTLSSLTPFNVLTP